MFQTAYSVAKHFTWPVVLSRLSNGGRSSSTIGAITILNEDGWFLTAAHLFLMLDEMARGEARALARETHTATTAGEDDPQTDDTRRASAWWGRNDTRLVAAHYIQSVDLGVGRLQPFDPEWVAQYPVLKNPAVNFDPGTSLCRLGFPFHAIVPMYDAATGQFLLPEGSTPIPLFPLEGILTRFGTIVQPPDSTFAYPLMQIETSSPGLRGQSGGPILDVAGKLWGIQSVTRHLPLGFDPEVVDTSGSRREHQFLNVGLGVHPVTIIGMLTELGVRFDLSDD